MATEPTTKWVELPEHVSHHAHMRAVDRFGFAPSRGDWNELLLAIVDGRTIVTRRFVNDDRQEHLVSFCGETIKAIYSPSAAKIVTLYTKARPKNVKRR